MAFLRRKTKRSYKLIVKSVVVKRNREMRGKKTRTEKGKQRNTLLCFEIDEQSCSINGWPAGGNNGLLENEQWEEEEETLCKTTVGENEYLRKGKQIKYKI